MARNISTQADGTPYQPARNRRQLFVRTQCLVEYPHHHQGTDRSTLTAAEEQYAVDVAANRQHRLCGCTLCERHVLHALRLTMKSVPTEIPQAPGVRFMHPPGLSLASASGYDESSCPSSSVTQTSHWWCVPVSPSQEPDQGVDTSPPVPRPAAAQHL